jgi:Mn-containing catalase
MQGSWNSGEQWERIDDLEQTMPIDGREGTATVSLGAEDQAALKQMMLRSQSDPSAEPMTGAELGAGPGAGRVQTSAGVVEE